MKYSLPFFLLLLFSCSKKTLSSQEYIVDNQSNKKVIGFADVPFTIGITHKSQISDLDHWKKLGIELVFNGIERLSYVKITSPTYQTSKGIKVGDTKKKVKELYGQPHTPEGQIQANPTNTYLYGNLVVLFDNKAIVKSLLLGEIR